MIICLKWDGTHTKTITDANGQFEMNWEFDDALNTADKHSFFKFMTKSIAEKHGFKATFMPKPIEALTGNGCHSHISAWDRDAKTNKFSDETNEVGLSDLGLNFLGGLMKHATSLTAITNPTVNSYKRINAPKHNQEPHGLQIPQHGRK